VSTLNINNIGPLRSLEIDLEDGSGGVMRLLAESGAGKSIALQVVNCLLGGGGRLEINDEAEDDGEKGLAEGFGAKLTIGKVMRSSGEAETPLIADRFDIASLVDPRDVSEDVRERRRIATLVGLGDAKADPALFYEVVGGKAVFDAIVSADAQKTDDIVELASRIKRAVDKAAKAKEDAAENATTNAKTAEAFGVGIDMTQPHDADVLLAAHTEATNKANTLKTQRTAYDEAKRLADEARAKLTEKGEPLLTIDDAQATLDAAKTKAAAIARRIDQLQAQLKEAQAELSAAEQRSLDAATILLSTKQAHAALQGWKDQIASFEKLPQPSDEEIAAAESAIAATKNAVDTGTLIRAAKTKLAEAETHRANAKELTKAAEVLRKAAAGVEGVLSKQIPVGPLRVVNERLVLTTDRKKNEPYADLSEGERVRTAVPYMVDFISSQVEEGKSGVFTLPQRMWQDLQPADRDWLAKYCAERRVWIVTAEVAVGELRAEVYEPVTSTEKKSKAKAK
jgi:hypothetical protein